MPVPLANTAQRVQLSLFRVLLVNTVKKMPKLKLLVQEVFTVMRMSIFK